MALVNINFTVLAHAYVLYARALQSRIRGGTFAALVRPALKSGTAMRTTVKSGTAFAVPAGPSTPPLLRRRRIYVTEEAFGCEQYFADGVNEGSSITFVRNALVALRSCLPRQGNERTASTSFSSQFILRCGILYSVHYWPRER